MMLPINQSGDAEFKQKGLGRAASVNVSYSDSDKAGQNIELIAMKINATSCSLLGSYERLRLHSLTRLSRCGTNRTREINIELSVNQIEWTLNKE